MNVADDKALRDLEFDRLKQIVRGLASSSLGAEAVDELVPISDRAAIEQGMLEVSEAMSYLERNGRFSLGGIRDLAPVLQEAKERAYVDGEGFLVVLNTIEGTREVRGRLSETDDCPGLRAHAERLTCGGAALERSIRQGIDERGAVRDNASQELARLTNKRRTIEERTEAKLRVLIDRNPELISEPVITRRRGRLVVPIRSGATGAMEFVVHDRSASGQTLYAEPTSLVQDNNALAELTEEIRLEVRRILGALTDAFLASEPAFLRDRAVLAHLDGLFARAAYARTYRCAFPHLGRRISLRDARHPLLPGEKAVPISLSFGDGQKMTVLTGPNTGGKTVTLKTVGLLTLMAQAAIPIPAAPDTEIAIVARVRSDIGDEQSIEQNLSTFSAHMTNIVSLLGQADAASLVVLDELGAGTDPQEGAALGLSVIEALLETQALVAISTHLTPLKYFAIRHPEIKTASMEFDPSTLAPTFRVVEGVPGRSNAFIIAQRLGLSAELVERARGFLSHGEIRAEDIIDELHRERRALAEHRERAARDRADAGRLKQEYESKLAAFERRKEAELSEQLRALETFLRDGQRQVEDALAAAHAAARTDEAKAGLHAISRLRREARDRRRDAGRRTERDRIKPELLEAGQLVHVRSVDADGRIVHVDPRGKAMVDLDGIRVSTEFEDLERPAGGGRSARTERRPSRVRRPHPEQVPLQLNVRGKTVNEALREIEEYLDQLLLADIRSASVLHGKGTGALRDAVHAYLGSCSFVTSFRFAAPNLGGDGVTVFELAGEETPD
jgi:DNA mismatch repair protein MutS2